MATTFSACTQGYDKLTARKHLLVFSLAAPVAAFISYFGLVRVSYSSYVFRVGEGE